MAATTATSVNVLPALNKAMKIYTTASTADSADTLDVSSDFVSIDMVHAYLATVGGIVEVTESSRVLTIDASGGRTSSAYKILVIGEAKA